VAKYPIGGYFFCYPHDSMITIYLIIPFSIFIPLQCSMDREKSPTRNPNP
jgi:hypothetical protein